MFVHPNSELLYDNTNLDKLDIRNLYVVDLLRRDVGYMYCKLCDRCYLKSRIRYHWNRRHIKYSYHKYISSKSNSSDFTITPHG